MNTPVDRLLPPPPDWMTLRDETPPCVTNPRIYQRLSDEVESPRYDRRHDHPLRLSAAEREARIKRANLLDRVESGAASACVHACPRFAECLHNALTTPAYGYVAATTPEQRRTLRDRLDAPAVSDNTSEMNDYLCGAPRLSGQRVPTEAIIEAIHNNPHAGDTAIARIVGCSARTISRYRRRAGHNVPVSQPAPLAVTPARAVAAWATMHTPDTGNTRLSLSDDSPAQRPLFAATA